MSKEYDYYGAMETTRKIEDARLVMQASIGLKSEKAILATLGIEDKTIQFWGCGPGHDSYLITKEYDPSRAIAFDINTKSIAQAKSRYILPNLSFEQADAMNRLNGEYDINFERFLLIQLPQEKVSTIIDNMIKSTKNGGKIVLIEYVNSFYEINPPCESLNKIHIIMQELFKKNRTNPDIGNQLSDYLSRAGLEEVVSHDIYYSILGKMFSEDIIINGINYDSPAKIMLDSHSERYKKRPKLIMGIKDWFENASNPNSDYSLKFLVKLAVGKKP